MVQMKIDLKGSGVDVNKTGFEPYEGPTPKPGVYAAVIRSCKVKISQAGNPYFNVQFELADQLTAEKQKAKGYPAWDRIVPGESDIQKERVGKFLHTVSGKDPDKVNIAIQHDEVTDGGNVLKIGGKDPVGTKCRITLMRGTNNGESVIEVRDLFPWPKNEPWPDGEHEDSDDSDDVEDAEDIEDADESEEADADETEDAEEGDEEESDEEEESDDEDEEEGDDEEEDDDEEFNARAEELGSMTRVQIKAELKKVAPDFKVLKKHTDEDLVNAVLDVEFPAEGGPFDES